MNRLDALGFLAGTLTTIAFLPQVARTWRTRKTDDISLVMLVMLTVGVGLWTIYGVLMKSLPMIVANTVTFFLILFILGIKIQNLTRRP
ncbi:MAG: SemiSWEET transporter [Nitrospinae bacterium]|nr:SemiSWEET transporter [Nitrospinota bacterium]